MTAPLPITSEAMRNAAPDMYAALIKAIESVPRPTGIGLGAGGLEWRYPVWFESACAAVFKAEGKRT